MFEQSWPAYQTNLKNLHELLQQIAESTYIMLSVTPCSTAVRAQHIRRPRRVHGVLDPKSNSAKKSIPQRDIHYIRRMDSTWERLCLLQPSSKLCLPGPHIPPNGPKITVLFCKTWFFAVRKKSSKFAWVKNTKKWKNHQFLRSPALQKSSKNRSKIEVPQNTQIYNFF